MVRYADDCVLGFQKHQDAVEYMAELTKRLGKFGLKVHPDKTKLIRFGCFAIPHGAGKPFWGKAPGTFDFLGFTHYIGRKRFGEVTVKRKTRRKRLVAQLKQIRVKLKKRMHHKPGATGQWLRRVVQGHINYYGVPSNSKSLNLFVQEVTKAWLWSLRRRSQRHRMNWKRFKSYVRYWIPNPQIVHPYPEQRFYAKHPR